MVFIKGSVSASVGHKRSRCRRAKLTPEDRSQSIQKATAMNGGEVQEASLRNESSVQKISNSKKTEKSAVVDTSNKALASLLDLLRTPTKHDEIRQVSDQIEQVMFHKQFANA
jgi:hypothetical protein